MPREAQGTQAMPAALSSDRDGSIRRRLMGIPNDSLAEHARDEKKRREAEEARKEKLEKSLERGLGTPSPVPIRSTSHSRLPPGVTGRSRALLNRIGTAG
jgi:hypothetical protein